MNIIIFLIPVALLLALSFVAIFIWLTRSGQYDDLHTPAHRMLIDDSEEAPKAR